MDWTKARDAYRRTRARAAFTSGGKEHRRLTRSARKRCPPSTHPATAGGSDVCKLTIDDLRTSGGIKQNKDERTADLDAKTGVKTSGTSNVERSIQTAHVSVEKESEANTFESSGV
ncbi:uncharacterized protein V6R79_024533 [Siganus canaliculatus]